MVIRMKTVSVVLSVLLLASFAPAQQKWIKTYGRATFDEGNSVQQTSDGGHIIAGGTDSSRAGLGDVYLIKTNASGNTVWTRTYGGEGDDHAFSVRQTSDRGYIIAGHTGSFGAGNYDVYLLKTNASGTKLWDKTYGGSKADRGRSVQQASDGGYIIAGYTESFGAGHTDVYFVKTNASGDTLWTRTYGGKEGDQGNAVQQTSDGGYVIAGLTWSGGAGMMDVYLIKTNASGDTLWTRTYGGSDCDQGGAVQQTKDGGYIIAGSTSSFGAGQSDFYLIKTDASGDTLWTRTYGGTDHDFGLAVQQTSDGGYVIAGHTASSGAGDNDVYLVRTNASGDTLWTRAYGGPETDEGCDVRQTSDGGYVVAGYTRPLGPGSSDVYLIKTDANGKTGKK
jgi:hypothetical protein